MLLRRTFLQRSALGGASCLRAAPGPRPNIVLVLADDLGYGDLSSYGCPDIRTPHIDSIGRQGVKFTQCYANAPECTPTRAALLTGRYQQRVGGLECAIGVGNVGRYDQAAWLAGQGELGLPAAEVTLSRLLKNLDYETACVGKWHLGYLDKFSPHRHGFDEYFGILGGNADYFTHREASGDPVLYHNGKPVSRQGYLTDLITGHAVDWLRRRGHGPFFLYVPYTAPHTPVQGPDDAVKKIDEATWNKGDRATYARMVERMDEGVGRILARLQEMGLSDNTIVLFLSDNGGYNLSRNDPFRGGKSSVYEGGIRVPCLIRWQGVIPPGSVSEQVALTMDLLPTLIAAAGGKLPPDRKFDGVDLNGVLRGRSPTFPRTVFWRYKRGDARRKAVRDGNLKLVWNDGQEELFDLDKDVRERRNLLAQLPGAARDLRRKLAAWEQEVAAPRLSGFPG